MIHQTFNFIWVDLNLNQRFHFIWVDLNLNQRFHFWGYFTQALVSGKKIYPDTVLLVSGYIFFYQKQVPVVFYHFSRDIMRHQSQNPSEYRLSFSINSP